MVVEGRKGSAGAQHTRAYDKGNAKPHPSPAQAPADGSQKGKAASCCCAHRLSVRGCPGSLGAGHPPDQRTHLDAAVCKPLVDGAVGGRTVVGDPHTAALQGLAVEGEQQGGVEGRVAKEAYVHVLTSSRCRCCWCCHCWRVRCNHCRRGNGQQRQQVKKVFQALSTGSRPKAVLKQACTVERSFLGVLISTHECSRQMIKQHKEGLRNATPHAKYVLSPPLSPQASCELVECK